MANMASGVSKRAHNALFDNQYSKATELFLRAVTLDPENRDHVLDLVYALNQNGDYITALTYCYALLGMERHEEVKEILYFLTAEAFGGIGALEACAQMLERCINFDPEGAPVEDAKAFLKDLREKYDIGSYNVETDAVELGVSNGLADAPFLNQESFDCVQAAIELLKEEKTAEARKRIEQEFNEGNYTVSLLTLALLLAAEENDRADMKRLAERFRFIDDYTLSELRGLAYNLSQIDDDDLAYDIYRQLYEHESGEKDIAFGFAVACEKIGETDHAAEIIDELIASEGGIGPAVAYRKCIGQKIWPYVYEYDGETGDALLEQMKDPAAVQRDPYRLLEALNFIRVAPYAAALPFVEGLCADDVFTEMQMRRYAIHPDVALLLRAKIASALMRQNKKKIFINSGSDIVEFQPGLDSVIEKFLQGENH